MDSSVHELSSSDQTQSAMKLFVNVEAIHPNAGYFEGTLEKNRPDCLSHRKVSILDSGESLDFNYDWFFS